MAQAIATSTIVQSAFAYSELAAPSSFADGSPEARAAEVIYPGLLRACLGVADWSFASQLEDLPEITSALIDDALPYAYAIPSTILKIRDVRPAGTAWRVDGVTLRADASGPLRVRATVRVDNETRLPGEFQDYVALRLASQLAARFASSANRAQILADRAHDALREALSADARQASTQRWDGGTGDGDWVAAVTRGGVL